MVHTLCSVCPVFFFLLFFVLLCLLCVWRVLEVCFVKRCAWPAAETCAARRQHERERAACTTETRKRLGDVFSGCILLGTILLGTRVQNLFFFLSYMGMYPGILLRHPRTKFGCCFVHARVCTRVPQEYVFWGNRVPNQVDLVILAGMYPGTPRVCIYSGVPRY